MSDETTTTGPSFVKREPVVTAGGSTVGAVGLAYGIMELAEAYDWQHFTGAQSKAIIGLVVIIVGLGSSLLASQKVTPTATAQAQILAAWMAPPPEEPEPATVKIPTTGGGLPVQFGVTSAGLSKGDQLVADAIAAQQLAQGHPENHLG